MPDLLSLPEELLCQISSFVHPQTVIDWACTCDVLWRCSLQVLKTQKQRRAELRVVHDRNPITIPLLLRSSLSEPEILWYIRSLEIWSLREGFKEWKSPNFNYVSEKHHDHSHLDITFYTDEELERYRSIFSNMLYLKEPLLDKWMERLRSGSDEPQKVLLMAMSPRLNKATFVEYDSGQSEERSHPFRLLASTLRALAPLPSPQWPCFQNLKRVFVGCFTKLRHPQDGCYPHSRVIAPLFLLPAIEELHLNLLMGEENDPESDLENDEGDVEGPNPYVWEWEIGRSSCQNLTFDCCELETETVASFIGATHSLRSLKGVANDDEIISALLEHSKHSLETMDFDERTSGLVPQHSLQSFQKLANIVLPTSQLVDKSTYKPSQIKYTVGHRFDVEESVFGTTDWVDLLKFFPPTLQTLKIYQSRDDLYGNNKIEHLARQLMALLNAKLSPTNSAFTSLTEICFADISLDSTGRWGVHEPWLWDWKRACEEAKVKIHIKRMSTEEQSGESYPCSFCFPAEIDGLESTPEVSEEEYYDGR